MSKISSLNEEEVESPRSSKQREEEHMPFHVQTQRSQWQRVRHENKKGEKQKRNQEEVVKDGN